jgi:hypothetical protein
MRCKMTMLFMGRSLNMLYLDASNNLPVRLKCNLIFLFSKYNVYLF